MLEELLQKLQHTNKQTKIIYPDIHDQRMLRAIMQLQKQWEAPVICWKKSELTLYCDFIAAWWEYFEVPDEEDNVVVAAQNLTQGQVDWFVGWNISATSDVVRALIKNVWSLDWISRISSHFLMWKDEEILLFSDAWIQVDPTSEQLSEIWYLTAISAIKYGIQPRIAMLSFSTAGSWWDYHSAVKVREAAKILQERLKREKREDIIVEGEIQFDAAFVPEIWKRKNPKTNLLEPANVFIFPDLDSANIAYKITQRLAGYTAIGPIIQWLAKPANDLSRGCSTEDIIAMHHITKNQ